MPQIGPDTGKCPSRAMSSPASWKPRSVAMPLIICGRPFLRTQACYARKLEARQVFLPAMPHWSLLP